MSEVPPTPIAQGTDGLVILIGPPGAGKTAAGMALATLLGWDFADTDNLIEDEAGASVSAIFVHEGEAAFRERERRVVREVLGTRREGPGLVVALGGGAAMEADNQAFIVREATVFLDPGQAAAIRRVGLDTPRPLLAASPRARWRALMAERRPTYVALARAIVHSDTGTPEDVARRIAQAMGLDKVIEGVSALDSRPYEG